MKLRVTKSFAPWCICILQVETCLFFWNKATGQREQAACHLKCTVHVVSKKGASPLHAYINRASWKLSARTWEVVDSAVNCNGTRLRLSLAWKSVCFERTDAESVRSLREDCTGWDSSLTAQKWQQSKRPTSYSPAAFNTCSVTMNCFLFLFFFPNFVTLLVEV